MKTIINTIIALATFAAAPVCTADTRADKVELAHRLQVKLEDAGYGVRDTAKCGDLEEGESVTVTTVLHAGNDYLLTVASPYAGSDVDVRVYDENGNLIGEDSDDTSLAIVKVSPKWSGKFRIVISMHSCPGLTAAWVLHYGFKN